MRRPILSLFVCALLSFNAGYSQTLTLTTTVSDHNGFAISCAGASDGSIDLQVSGGSLPYTYVWSTINGASSADGATSQDLQDLSTGTYTVIVTDSVGAADTLSVFLSAPTAVSISLYSPAYNGFNVHCHAGNTGEINATVSGGVSPYSYSWSTGDSVPNIGGLTAGTYQLVVTGANGCVDIASITLSEPNSLTTTMNAPVTASGLEVACEGEASASIDLTVSGGAGGYSYNWSNGGITEDLNGLGAGWYSVQVEDANNCARYDSLEIREPLLLQGEGAFFEYQSGEFFSCDTCSDAQVTATATGGTQPYTFTLTSGGQTVASQTGGTSFTINDLSSNIWYVGTITDAAGCADVDSFMIPANPAPEPLDVIGSVSSYPGGYQVSSYGGNDGWIDIQIEGGTGPYSYAWSTANGSAAADGATTQDLNTLAAGTYMVIVTDASSEQVEKTFTLNQPTAPLQATFDGVIPQCFGAADGQLEVLVSGGVLPYSYMWSNGASTSGISGLEPGPYSVTVYDANNDSIVLNDTLPAPAELITTILPSFDNLGYQLQCAFDDTTRLDLQVLGGEAPYDYQWDNGKFSQDIDVFNGGWYHVIVTDNRNCKKRDSVLINAPAEPEMDAQWHTYPNGELFSCDTCNDAQLTLAITGAITPVSMTLTSNTQTLTGPTFTGIYADTVYELRFEDGLGCVMEMTGDEALVIPREGFNSLGVSAELSQYPGGYNISTHGGNDGWIDIDVFGQMSQETVLWSDGNTSKYRSGLSAGTYEVTVSDNAGQSITKSWTLAQPAASLSATIIGPATPCELFAPLTANVSGGAPPYSYTWVTPSGDTIHSSILNASQEGLHELLVVDANGDLR